jgi:hypothetical protein
VAVFPVVLVVRMVGTFLELVVMLELVLVFPVTLMVPVVRLLVVLAVRHFFTSWLNNFSSTELPGMMGTWYKRC